MFWAFYLSFGEFWLILALGFISEEFRLVIFLPVSLTEQMSKMDGFLPTFFLDITFGLFKLSLLDYKVSFLLLPFDWAGDYFANVIAGTDY